MSNDFYTPSGAPASKASLDTAPLRAEFALIQTGFDKVSPLTGKLNLPVFSNATGTAQETKSIATAQGLLGLPVTTGNANLPVFVNAAATATEAKSAADARTLLGLGTAAVTASTAYAPAAHVGAGAAAHANAVSGSDAGFMTGADKAKLDGVAASANAYVHPNHSGEVTSTADGAQVIANNAVTLAKLATQAADTVLANATSGAAVPTAVTVAEQTLVGRITGGHVDDLSASQVRTLLNVADGATANAGTVTGVTGTAPVVSSGGAAPAISMAAATASANGYMTSTYAAKLDAVGTMANRAVTISASDPSGGSDGDIWFKYV